MGGEGGGGASYLNDAAKALILFLTANSIAKGFQIPWGDEIWSTTDMQPPFPFMESLTAAEINKKGSSTNPQTVFQTPQEHYN